MGKPQQRPSATPEVPEPPAARHPATGVHCKWSYHEASIERPHTVQAIGTGSKRSDGGQGQRVERPGDGDGDHERLLSGSGSGTVGSLFTPEYLTPLFPLVIYKKKYFRFKIKCHCHCATEMSGVGESPLRSPVHSIVTGGWVRRVAVGGYAA